MQIDRWQHVQDLYFRALEMPEIHRTPFLKTACESDPRMQREVESLLECEDKIGDFLETMPMDVLEEIVDDSTTDDEADDLIGAIIDDRYVVTQRVGSGGMGEVYRADHRLLGNAVAIKRLARKFRDRKDHRQRFLDEARRATLLDHENVTRVKDVVEQSGEVFVVMEFIDGHTLRTFRDSPPGIEEFLDIAIQCASGLAAAHQRGIAHLDIKPANIMLTESHRVKICDFGVARQIEPTKAANRSEEERWTFGGTPAYMAPEVLESNHFDVRADIFSMGVVFYELLSGKHPFWDDDVRSTTNKIVKGSPPPLKCEGKKPPARLVRLIETMLSKDPARRLTAAETLRELQAIQRRRSFMKDVGRSPGQLIPLVRKRPISALLVAMLAIGVGLTIFANKNEKRVVAVLPCIVDGEQTEAHRKRAMGVAELVTIRLEELTSLPQITIKSPESIREEGINTTHKARVVLGANLVVSCTLAFSDNEVTFTHSLIRAADDPKNNETLQRGKPVSSSKDDSAFSERITEAVAATLEIQLEPSRSPGTGNEEAFALYRLGLGFMFDFTDPKGLDQAVSLFNKAIDHDPAFGAAFSALGQALAYKYDQTKDPNLLRDSLANCQRAESVAPESSDTQVCLGRVYLKMGVLPLAEETLKEAIRFSATNDEAIKLLGLVYENSGRFDQAKEHYLHAIELRKDWASYSWIAGFYAVALRDYPTAQEYYKKALAVSPGGKNARVLNSLGGAYGMAGDYPHAIKALEDSDSLLPHQPKTLSNLGLAYWKAGENDRAISAFERAVKVVERDGGDHAALGNLARVYWFMNQKEKARDFYQRAITAGKRQLEADPDDPNVHILLGRYYAALGEPAKAKLSIDRALNHETRGRGKNAHFLLIAATGYALLGEKTLALDHMERAIHNRADRVEVLGERELEVLKDEPKYKTLIANLK